MPLDFAQQQPTNRLDSNATASRIKPVNWRSRPMQIRLMIAVAAVLSVIAICERLLSGSWRTLLDTSAVENSSSAVETRLPARRPKSLDDLATISAPWEPRPWSQETTVPAATGPEAKGEVSQDFWKRLYQSLKVKQRDQMEASLRFALRDASNPLGTSDRAELLSTLERWVADYSKKTPVEIKNAQGMSESKREAFLSETGKLLDHWRAALSPALARLLKGEPPAESDREHLATLAATWRELAFADVKDDASSTGADSVAWFSLFDSLMHDAKLLDGASEVSYAALFDQSERFRAKPIAVTGEIRSAAYEKAGPNLYGIKGYYVCWVRPDNYVDAPLRVFSLEAPNGEGASIDEKNLADLTGRRCELKGVFFKRMAYRAQDDIRAVPTILSKGVTLLEANDSLEKENGSMTLAMLLVVSAAVGGVLLAIYAFSDRRRKVALPEKLSLPEAPTREPSQWP